MAASAYFDAVQKLYVAYYGRPADTVGLNFWAEKIDAAGGKIEDVVDAFGNSAEAQTIYGNVAIVTQVNNVFNNILGRDADVTGLNFYANKVANGEYSLASLAQRILDGATTGDDAQVVANKLAAAKAFTAAIDTAAEVLAYTGDTAAQQARDFLATVTADAATVPDATEAQTAVSGLTGADQNPGQTFTLTTGVDAVPGTTGNDTINAVIDATVGAVASTWTALDSIDGGAGTDTLKISAITDFAAPGGATVTNVEKVQIAAAAKVGTFAADATGDVDLSTVFAGVTDLTITSGSEADFKAGTSTAVNLSGVTGGVEVVGGASQTVSLAAQGGSVALSGTTGAVSFTSAKHGNNTVAIDGGSTVTVATTSTVDNGTITIGALLLLLALSP